MHNPSDAELNDMEQEAIACGDNALEAFEVYITALGNRDEAIDEQMIECAVPDPARLNGCEAHLSAALQELNHQLGRVTQ